VEQINPTRRAKGTLLAISTAVLAFNYTDGQVLALVLQNIKTDLHLSDSQLGFLSGLAFAIFYASMGIPIARLADRGNRVAIISITTAIWSLFVMACGAATSFLQLFLVRIGVAVGEAGCIPPAQSLLSDFFPRDERTRAFAIYTLGSPLSVILGSFAAGWINQYYGWRATFVILGSPGIPLAILAWVMLREPRRAAATGPHAAASTQLLPADGSAIVAQPAAAVSAEQQSLKNVVRALAKSVTFIQLLIANTLLYFFVYAAVQWQPSFFIRTHRMTTGEIGTWELVSWALMGTLGTYGAGLLVHRFLARNEKRQLQMMSLSVIVFGALNVLIYLVANRYVALGLLVLAAPFYTGIFGPLFALNQSVVPESMRATAVALLLFFANLIGMGVGGFVTGLISDALVPTYGTDSLRYALLVLTPGFFWCATHFWLASRTVAADFERAHG
jgi:MFS family permease